MKGKQDKVKFSVNDILDMVLAPCKSDSQGRNGAKTVPRNPANKNTPHKNSEFMRFWISQNTEKTKKNAIQIS